MAERQVTRGGSLLYDSIADWLMDVALTGESDVQAVVDGACHRLLAAGVPIARVHIAFRTLHPLFAAVAYLWRPDTGAVSSNITHESVQLGRGWEASAYYLDPQKTQMDWMSDMAEALSKFAVENRYAQTQIENAGAH